MNRIYGRIFRYGGVLALAAILLLLPLAARETAPARSMEDGLDRLLAGRQASSLKVALHAVSIDDGRVLYSRRADDPMVPASKM